MKSPAKRGARASRGSAVPRAPSSRSVAPNAAKTIRVGAQRRSGAGRPRRTDAPRVAIVGAGRVASALGVLLAKRRWTITAIASARSRTARALAKRCGARIATTNPQRAARGADVVLIAVSDRSVPRIAAQLAGMVSRAGRAGPIALHTSGVGGVEWLSPLAARGWSVGSIHPLIVFPPAEGPPPSLRGATFAIDGDARARGMALRMVDSLEGKPVRIPGSARARYHLAACLASNYVVALVGEAVELLAGPAGAQAENGRTRRRGTRQGPMGPVGLMGPAGTGLSRRHALEALTPLLRSTLQSLETIGLPGALTGPVARGDAATVARHVAVLKGESAELRQLHRSVVLSALRLATPAEGRRVVATARRLREALGDSVRRTRTSRPGKS